MRSIRSKLTGGAFDTTLQYRYGDAYDAQKNKYAALTDAFAGAFGESDAAELFSAPGRSEIGGNHTDHQHGCVLAAAVDYTHASTLTASTVGHDTRRTGSTSSAEDGSAGSARQAAATMAPKSPDSTSRNPCRAMISRPTTAPSERPTQLTSRLWVRRVRT